MAGDDPAPRESKIGRSPSDAVVEVFDRLVGLLGEKFIYLVFFAAIGALWWFFDEQERQRRALYEESVVKLQEQRDSAFDQLRAFNTDVATISSAQVKTVGDALEQLKSISAEAETLRKESYERQLAIDLAEREAEESRAELADATKALTAQQLELSTNLQRLGELQAGIEQRDAELMLRGADLERRAARIGELTELLRRLDATATAAIDAERARLDELAAAARDALDAVPEEDRDRLRAALDSSDAGAAERDAFEAALNALRDRVVEPERLLAPIVDLRAPAPGAGVLDDLIGLSFDRLVAAVSESAGMGFDVWLADAAAADERVDFAGVYALAIADGWFREVLVEGGRGEDGVLRITSVDVVEGLLPICGPGLTEAYPFRCTIFVHRPETPGALDETRLDPAPGSWTDIVPYAAWNVTVIHPAGDVAPVGIAVLGEPDLDRLAATVEAPAWVRQALRVQDAGPRLVLAMARALAEPEATAARLVPGGGELEAAIRATLAAILANDPLAPAVMVEGATESEIGVVAAIAARPGARLTVVPGQRVAIGARQQMQQQAPPTEPAWSDTAQATLELPRETNRQLRFARSSDDPGWRLTAIQFTRASRW